MGKFTLQKTVYLNDTNAEGNVYFARFFDWQGETREAYLKQTAGKEELGSLFGSGARMLTVNASMEFYAALWLFDEVRIELTTCKIRRASFGMIFRFFKVSDGALVGRGLQKLAFQDPQGRLMSIPPFIYRIAVEIEESSDLNPNSDSAVQKLVAEE